MSSISASSTSAHVNGTTCLDSSETSSKNGAKNNNNSSSSSGHSDPHDKFTNNGEATDDLKATQQQIKNLEMELKHARDALSVLKADRKRLKAEKFDVLNQMKQLYATLEDKEKELRDFIRTYEKRMRESEAALRQLIQERDEAEREKWTILRHARDEAERCLNLTNQLALRDVKMNQLQEEVCQLRAQLNRQEQEKQVASRRSPASLHDQPGQRSSLSSTGSTVVTSDAYEEPLYSRIDHSDSIDSQTVQANLEGAALVEKLMADVDALSLTSVSTIPGSLPAPFGPEDKKPEEVSPPPTYATVSKSNDHLSRSVSSFSSKTLGKLGFAKSNGHNNSASSSGSTNYSAWGSISRVFSRHIKQQRKTLDMSLYEGNGGRDGRRSWSPRDSLCTTPLTEETVADRFRYWDEAQSLMVEQWKAGHVLAWLEFGLGMGHYISTWAGNIKSGKVLLELTDTELEAGLGLTHAMHRKKIRLAIEERRNPSAVRYPLLSSLGNMWVTSEWLADIGLTQYADSFASCLMDARMLDNLTKRELEKYLGVTKKSHQSSIVHGITFLRMMKYDRKVIAERRKQCETSDCDPLVWTNQRLVTWAKSIDLAEYADNLKDSGVHGALMVLDLSFNADAMATAMGIPSSKNIIRRHLATELESLVQVARARYEQRTRQSKVERKRAEKLAGGSLGRSFSRSFTGGLSLGQDRDDALLFGKSCDNGTLSKSKMRASLSRAFGRKVKQEMAMMANPSVPTPLRNPTTPIGDDYGRCAPPFAASDVYSSSYRHPEASNWNQHRKTHSNSSAASAASATAVSASAAAAAAADKHRRVRSSSDIESITITRV